MKFETAGDPISGLKWTRKTTEKIANELAKMDIIVSKNTVGKLLKKMGYSLKVNQKKIAKGGKSISITDQKNRDNQFKYIGNRRKSYAKSGYPIISVDTKKKDLVGNFKNQGSEWSEKGDVVNDHDFPSYAVGKFIPYSIYDTEANLGSVFVGTTHDTPAFAVDSIVSWWEKEGLIRYPYTNKILILADAGGSNGARSRVWKKDLQNKLCDRFSLTVTVCHYPPGTSKWNPVEHRLHSEISKNWRGKPLRTYETVLKLLRTTKTLTGLKVRAYFVRKHYKIGQRATDDEMNLLTISPHKNFPEWNYTICPR